MKTPKNTERIAAIKELKKLVKPGDTIYTILNHVSTSGMFRCISMVIPHKKQIRKIDWYYCKITGQHIHRKHGGIPVTGCGMDMGYHLVHNLGYYLYKNGFKCIGEKCPANDHHNPPYPEKKKGSTKHTSSGYALNHSWL